MQRVLCVVNMVCECLREWIKSMKGKKLEIKKRKINIVCKWKFSLFTFYLAKQKHTSIGLKRRQKSHFEVESQMPSSAEEQQYNSRKIRLYLPNNFSRHISNTNKFFGTYFIASLIWCLSVRLYLIGFLCAVNLNL